MPCNRVAAAVAALACVLAAPGAAHAFADVTQFFDNPANPHAATLGASGEGVYFTGSPRFASLGCQSCHQGGPQRLGFTLNADDPGLFRDGYIPNHTYALEVELTNESSGTKFATPTCTEPPSPDDTFSYVPCNPNAFALEIDAAGVPLSGFCARAPAGTTCPAANAATDEVLLAPGGDAVFANRVRSTNPDTPKLLLRNGALTWHFWWTSPRAGTGPVTVYAGAVDGNGGNGTAAIDQDPYNDDTVQATFYLQEAGAPVGNRAAAGCSVAGDAPGAAWLVLALLLAARRRRSAST